MMKAKLLVSACLLGVACRYDGASKGLREASQLRELMERAEFIPVCPEVYGGLPTPRDPAERRGDAVVTCRGVDVTAQYERGAQEALRLARLTGAHVALLKARSPSCGRGEIHNGLFDGGMMPGDGVTAALLKANGIDVYNENEIPSLLRNLKEGRYL